MSTTREREEEKEGGALTVSEASRHAGRGERVTLLGVDELADGGQLVDLSGNGRGGAEGGLR